MNKKTFFVSIVTVLLFSLGFLIFEKNHSRALVSNFAECAAAGNPILESYPRMCRGEDGTLYTEEISVSPIVTPDKSDLIRVSNPVPNQVIVSPMTLTGEARGNWFFEASFSGVLLDANGNNIATFIAQAEGDWMTAEFVPFKATLEFKNPGTQKGTLVFKKDNPSDMRQFDDELRVPIQFDATSDLSLKVYFGNERLNPDDNVCTNTYPVTRVVPKTEGPARAAILELLKGTSESEKQEGYTTSINEGVILQKISIVEGTAFVDFNDTLEKGGGSCSRAMISQQISATLKQFPTVKHVVISINGRTEDILQP